MTLPYNPALDGLRALACLAVVGIHANVPGFQGGYLGVDVFFVLSGYLITRVLLTSRPTLPQFYWRRARRLYPALLFMLAIVLAIQGLLGLPVEWGNALMTALYLTDYWTIIGSPFAHSWSLSAEEHFYLIWPMLLPVLLRWKRPWQTMALLALVLLVWREAWENIVGWRGVYNRFDTHATGLAAGCALGLHPNAKLPAWCGWLGAAVIVAAMALFPVTDRNIAAFPVAEAGTLLVIAGGWGPQRLAFIGRLSYGWYLWHWPLICLALTANPGLGWKGKALVGGVGGLALAWVSYRTVETKSRSPRPVPTGRPLTE